jgi:Ni/Fe-hydrogenase subunit HybB-like protein
VEAYTLRCGMESRAAADTRLEWLTAAILVVVLLGMYAALLLPDDVISWLLKEERPLEGVGAVGLLLASILSFLLWRRERREGGHRWLTLSYLGLAIVFFVAFGEEISWGQRILGLETPESLESLNDQGETNLHNLSTGKANALFQLFWIVMGVLIPLAALYEPARRRLLRLVPILPVALVIVFLANQLVIKIADEIFEAHPGLYEGTTYSVSYGLYEIKETVVQIAFAAGFWLLYRAQTRHI